MSSSTPIDSTLLAYRADDKPILIARNILEEGASGYPRANISGLFSDADSSDADYPIRNIHDRRRGTQWRAGGATSVEYILLDAGAGEALEADCLIIEGHEEVLDGHPIRIRCGDVLVGGAIDAGDPSTYNIATATGGTDRYVGLFDSIYSARYWEIRFAATPGTETWRARQVFLGTQVFLPHHGNVPYDEYARVGEYAETKGRDGSRTRVSRFYDIRRREFQAWIENSDTIAALRQAWDDALGWARAVWHIEFPTSSPEESALFGYIEEPALDLPSQLEQDRIWEATIVEDGPHLD